MFGGGGLEDRLRRELARRDHFALIMPLPDPVAPPPEDEIIAAIRTVVAPSGAGVAPHPVMRGGDGPTSRLSRLLPGRKVEDSGRNVFLVVSDVALWLAFRDGPVRDHGDPARFVNPETWPEGADALAQHRGHVEICDLGMIGRNLMPAPDAAFNRAVAVTAAAAALTRSMPPLAMLWHPARAALPPRSFRDQIGRLLVGQAPLELWMRWFYLRGGEGECPGVITRGLRPFIGREIEVRPSQRPEGEALSLAFAAASLMIDHGGALTEGQSFAPLPDLSARVRLGESRARQGLPVFELSVSGGPASAPPAA